MSPDARPAHEHHDESFTATTSTGRVGNLTPEQAEQLAAFRARIVADGLFRSQHDSIGSDDATLLRFLRARNFRLDASLAMFRACQAFRADAADGKSIDELWDELDWTSFEHKEEIFKYWPMLVWL
jgi:hypothetical protein